ncbi:uncharacterized protein LOC131667133 [Phymastichus coffea]|uniref:uncharacterized protein LOC131667133 n=1 Tax=Phymastichus coffea TaxID=108790 RepID=UPI00273C47E3|nr:uncharacterized protein LOC131667133 [Phymastichus coffea]
MKRASRSGHHVALLAGALVCAAVGCHARLPVSSYARELTLYNAEIILGGRPTTRSGSLVYAVCEQLPEYLFDQVQCNVSVEAPAFAGSTLPNRTCRVLFAPEEPRAAKLAELRLHLLDDRKALFSWSVASERGDWRTNVRVLSMAGCAFSDVSLPVRSVAHAIARKAGFDLIVGYRSFCGAASLCKLSYDAEGKRLAGPVSILYDSDVPVVIPPAQPFLDEGYLLAGVAPRGYVVKVEADGRLRPLMAIDVPPGGRTLRATVSSLHGFHSLCALANGSALTCHLHEPRSGFRASATLRLDDDDDDDPRSNATRWIATRNSRRRSLTLLTGRLRHNGSSADDFSVVRLHSDGRWGRPVRLGGIGFKGVDEFHAGISKNKLDELCFHFVAKQNKSYRDGTINRLKLAIKCLSMSHLNADNLLVVD